MAAMTPDNYLLIRPTVECLLNPVNLSFLIDCPGNYTVNDLWIEIASDFREFTDTYRISSSSKTSQGFAVSTSVSQVKKPSQVQSDQAINKNNVCFYVELSQTPQTIVNSSNIYYRALAVDKRDPKGQKISVTTEFGENMPFIHGLSPLVKPLYYNKQYQQDQLKVQGNKLIASGNPGQNNTAVLLRGINFSGMDYTRYYYLAPEKRIPGNYSDPYYQDKQWWQDIQDRDQTKWNTTAGITEDRIKEVARWGANVIRITINQDWILNGFPASDFPYSDIKIKNVTLARDALDYLESIDQIVVWAISAKIRVILCPSKTRLVNLKGSAKIIDAKSWFEAENCKALFQGYLPDNRSLLVWKILATRYSQNSYVFYELWNEPHEIDADAKFKQFYTGIDPNSKVDVLEANPWIYLWHDWVRKIEELIHTIDPSALIFIQGFGGPMWSGSLRCMPVLNNSNAALPNTLYTAHFYYHDYNAGENYFNTNMDELKYLLTVKDHKSGNYEPNSKKKHDYLSDDTKKSANLLDKYPVFITEWGVETLAAEVLDSPLDDSITNADVGVLNDRWKLNLKTDSTPPNSTGGKGDNKVKDVTGDSKNKLPDDNIMLTWGKDLLKLMDELSSGGNDSKTNFRGLAGWTAWSYGGRPRTTFRETPFDEGKFVENKDPAVQIITTKGKIITPTEEPTDFGEIVIEKLYTIKTS